jgi:tetratricopeptide (TPR) repeat protein
MIKRRDFLALSGTALLWRPSAAQAETLTVHYHKDPPYFALRKFIESGSDAFGPDPVMPPVATPSTPPANARFAEITGAVLDSDQLSKGIPYWVARLDPASGIDLYGNQGISAADVDGDGRDEIYVCQPGGLPNKLFRWAASGKLEDISAQAGLDILDDTTSALFLDLRNSGTQDLILLGPAGPELFLNNGRGRFTHKPGSFEFARAPQGGFTGMAAADYDRDGKLDVYLCCYSFFQSEAQYKYPAPYHDAQNGPPNFLFRNRLNADGSGKFEDVTQSVGLDQNNNRFSFAPAWCDYDGSGWPSLYVANDFGRNNLYRNRAGKFVDVAAEVGVEDMGPGMSACWFDENGDGRPDLYVSNMWTRAGQAVVRSPTFQHQTPELKEAYRRHTKGNSLYLNRGDGSHFEDAGAARNVEIGKWAWSADAADFDNDGVPEIYVTCGMLTGPRTPDLMSFFWRQVVAKSNADATPSASYEAGWNAINQFIREGYSWNGNESNVFFVRETASAYRDLSLESGLGFVGDSRAFAVTDFNHDGCLDIAVKNRLGPQLRVFENRIGQQRHRIAFDLQGVKCNRDAVGAKVEVDGQAKWLNAGSGYLSQHSKRIHFGLKTDTAQKIRITWPSGTVQEIGPLAAGRRYRILEGENPKDGIAFANAAARSTAPTVPQVDNLPRLHDTWLLDPVPLPDKQAGPVLLVLHGAQKPTAPAGAPSRFVDLRAAPDQAAAYTLFRRYLFEFRPQDLDLPLMLLVDERGHARKIYAQMPSAASLKQDLAKLNETAVLPFHGKWIRGNGQHLRDHYKLGAALLWSGYDQYSLPYLEASLSRQPENSKMWMLAGRAHLRLHALPRAEDALKRATTLDPNLADAWNELGGVEAARNNYAAALQHYQRALSIQDDLAYCHLNAGQACERLGRLADAEQHFRKALALDASSPEASNGLGLILAKQGKAAEAKTLLQTAIRLKPDFAAAVNNLGVLYMQQGQINDAIAAFRYGIQASPKEEILYLNLARIYVQSGDREKARQLMQDLLASVPSSNAARKALRDLENQ